MLRGDRTLNDVKAVLSPFATVDRDSLAISVDTLTSIISVYGNIWMGSSWRLDTNCKSSSQSMIVL